MNIQYRFPDNHLEYEGASIEACFLLLEHTMKYGVQWHRNNYTINRHELVLTDDGMILKIYLNDF